jgi:hypothetical protein
MPHALQLPFRFSLRSTLFIGIGLVLILLFLSYIVFQARFLLQGPIITLQEEPTIEQTEQKITLRGTVRNITKLTLNGRQIFTDETGYFEEAMFIENGYTIATLAATDRYGRETKVVRPFVYLPAFDTASVTNHPNDLPEQDITIYGNEKEEN